MKLRLAAICAATLAAVPARAEEAWRFLLLADWHQAEKYTQSEKNPEWLAGLVAEDIATVRMLKENYGGDVILLPGDSNGGHWDTPKFIKANYPGCSPEEVVLRAGRLCYSGMIGAFHKGGYSKLIMAVGDHELGDNPWPAGSAVARCQPQFREAFARALNTNPDGGRFLYDKPVGSAPSRPLGTKYQNTSYAYRHKNALFVTIDAFHQEGPNKVIGSQGTVTGTVTGRHLEWLEDVLAEAREDAGIKHIFVQSHLPVIYPVRKVNSSGMLMDGGVENPFWKTLRKFEVDIYFAGEVHANTVTRDAGSDLIQLVSRGNFFNNFQTLDVTDSSIEVICYQQEPGSKTSEGKYEVSGRLLIDKSGGSTRIEGEGELALFDVESRILHFDFEEDAALADNPIMGLAGRNKKGNPARLRGVECARIFPNKGTFGKHYSALTAKVARLDGPRGKAGRFDRDSRMGVFAMGPHYGGHAVSYSLWVNTAAAGNQILINSGAVWGASLKHFFNLHLNSGTPELMVAKGAKLTADGVKLNDGKWHHVAAVMPDDSCKLSEVLIYVDGRRVAARVEGVDGPLHFNQAVRLGFGGWNYSHEAFDQLPVEPLDGAMDDISIWARPLGADEVLALYAD